MAVVGKKARCEQASATKFRVRLWILIAAIMTNVRSASHRREPIRIHPDNPRYFLWREHAVALLGSGEHYGALLNLNFDFETYLTTLAENGFTLTQVFSGAYVEPDIDLNNPTHYPPGMNPNGNPLSPSNGSYISPWARTDVPGNAKGGTKWNLTQYNQTYFHRLVDFASAANASGIVVELSLFCGYEVEHDSIWETSPFNPKNNVNGLVALNASVVYSLSAPAFILDVQYEMTRRILEALRPFDNVIIQMMFMPSILPGDHGKAWGQMLSAKARATDSKRLFVVPESWKLSGPHATFLHSPATGPQSRKVPAIADSWGTLCPTDSIGPLAVYRAAYWGWMLGGGGALYNVDFSYTVGHETGTKDDNYTRITPSGPAFRGMVRILADFVRTLDLAWMEPRSDWVRPFVPALVSKASSPTKYYSAYVNDTSIGELYVRLGAAETCIADWTDVATGIVSRVSMPSAGSAAWRRLVVPRHADAAACLILCRDRISASLHLV